MSYNPLQPATKLFVLDVRIDGEWHRITPPLPYNACKSIQQSRIDNGIRGEQYEIRADFAPVTGKENAYGDQTIGVPTIP